MNKIVKKVLIFSILAIVAVLIGFWIYFGTPVPETFSYEGYIVGVRQSGNDIAITTLSGDTKSEFMLKWYTKKSFHGDLQELEEGAYIKLNTTGGGVNVKNFSAYEGYTMNGKLVFVEGQETPYLLTMEGAVNYYMLYSVITSQEIKTPMKSGMEITAYYQYPLNASITTLVVDAIEPASDISTLTEDELGYITRQGYTVIGNE